MAYLFQRLAVCLRYLIALFSCQRTQKKKIVFPIYRVGKEQKRNQYSKLFSFPVPYRERKCHSAKLLMKKLLFIPYLPMQHRYCQLWNERFSLLHIGNGNLDLMSSFEKKLDFLSSHHICTQVAVLLQIF